MKIVYFKAILLLLASWCLPCTIRGMRQAGLNQAAVPHNIFDTLSHDIRNHIFMIIAEPDIEKYYKFRQSCSSWNTLLQEPAPGITVDVSNWNMRKLMGFVEATSPTLKAKIHFFIYKNNRLVTDEFLLKLIPSLINLVELDLGPPLNLINQTELGLGHQGDGDHARTGYERLIRLYLSNRSRHVFAIRALQNASAHLNNLKIINLEHSTIDGTVLQVLMRNNQGVEVIRLSACERLTSPDFFALALVHSLRKISACSTTLSWPAIGAAARVNRALESLSVGQCSCLATDDSAACEQLHTLRSFKIFDTPIHGVILKKIVGANRYLERIDLSYCIQLTRDDFDELATLHTLKNINVSMTQLDDEKLKKIVNRNPNITVIYLDTCPNLTAEGFMCLSALDLTHLSVGRVSQYLISVPGGLNGRLLTAILLKSKNLKYLNVGNNKSLEPQDFRVLETAKKVEELDLSYTKINAAVLAGVVANLHRCRLRKVDASFSQVSGDDALLRRIRLDYPDIKIVV